jgi:hypothetical protein
MAVDLAGLVDSLKREVSAPGEDVFPDGTDDNYIGSLTDAFWEVRLYGLLSGWEENAAARGGPSNFSEGIITPIGVNSTYDSPSGYSPADLSRELQQLVVLWAAWKIVLTRMSSVRSVFRAKAGAVEFETQQAATVLKTVLDALKDRIEFLLRSLSTYGSTTAVMQFDAVLERSYATALHGVWWVA